LIPYILEPDGSSEEYRENWARLIQKIYDVNPLTLLNFPKGILFNRARPKCQGRMKVIGFIEDKEVIEKFLDPTS